MSWRTACSILTGSHQLVDVRTAPYAVFILRLAAGVALLAHSAYLKVFVFTIAGTEAFFQSLGLPAILVSPVLAIEIITGLMLLAGWHTRYAALAATPVLLGATWAHVGNGWQFSSAGGGWEYPLFWAVALIAIALLGDGAFAISSRRQQAGPG